MQTLDALTVTATVTDYPTATEAVTKMAAAKSKGDCENNRLTRHDDLLCQCTLHSPRFQGPLSVNRPQRSSGSMAYAVIYEGALRFASLILPLLTQACGISHSELSLFVVGVDPLHGVLRRDPH
jgi:hypothetical protein